MKKKTVITHTPQTVEDEDGARYEFDIHGDWIGWIGQRRTLLKSTLDGARADVAAVRFVCPCWPDCKHKGPK